MICCNMMYSVVFKRLRIVVRWTYWHAWVRGELEGPTQSELFNLWGLNLWEVQLEVLEVELEAADELWLEVLVEG